MVHIINYRLHRPSKDYEALYKAIKGISGTYWHNTTSSWVIASFLTPEQVFKELEPHIDKNDELAVFRLQGDYYGQLNPDDIKWLKGVLG